MQCSFDETIDLPSGGFQRSKCINQADILVINDPCCGLCFACAYQKLQAENEKLRKLLIAAEPNWAISNWLERELNKSQADFDKVWSKP